MRGIASVVLLATTLACAGSPGAGPHTPAAVAPGEPPPKPAEPPKDEIRATVPAAPASCAQDLVVDDAAPAPAPACDESAARSSLASALGRDGQERDRALRALESCNTFSVGSVRALRAELAPVQCADLLTAPLLATPPARLPPELLSALRGLDLAAKANRLVRDPPTLPPPHDKGRVSQFVTGALSAWILAHAAAIFELSSRGASLEGYGKGVVAVEAGLADMRFVDVVREVPLPDEFRDDPALSEAYYASLDEALEPRKRRGRDAALIGLSVLGEVGVTADPRVERARTLLSRLFAGRRIDALDALLLPKPPSTTQSGADAELARLLPTFHVGVLVPQLLAKSDTLELVAERGLPRAARLALQGTVTSPSAKAAFARALFRSGQTHWRTADFAQAAQLAANGRQADLDLIAVLGPILARGPANATQMMLGGPHLPPALGEVAALDALGKDSPSLAGFAAYNAGVLRELARPADADAAYWKDIAKRYELAERRLPPDLRKLAAERRRGALEVAGALTR